jgi:hypothetical protein
MNLPGVKSGRRLKLTTSLPSVSSFVEKCGILDVSEPYGPPQAVTEIYLLWPCLSPGGYSQDSHRGGPGSSPGQVMWDSWLTKRHGASFLRVLLFYLPIIPTAPQLSLFIIRGWYNRPNGGLHA